MSTTLFPVDGIATPRLILRKPTSADATLILNYQINNRAHLQQWEPLRDDDFFTLTGTEHRIAIFNLQIDAGVALHLLVCDKASGEILGICNFTNIIRGVFQACFMGFSLAADAQGHGYMQEALGCAIRFMFRDYELHRVMANYRPENKRSAALLATLGFEIEGTARSYLKINGQWADHVLASKINRLT